jgi:pyruvate,water dikinase
MSGQENFVLLLSDIRRGDVARVGGKNASLGEMIGQLKEAGIRVPGGFATTAAGYWRFVEANQLHERHCQSKLA